MQLRSQSAQPALSPESSDSTESAPSSPPDNCSHCNCPVLSIDSAVQCEICDLWQHCCCIGISQALYDSLIDSPTLAVLTICLSCRQAIAPKPPRAPPATTYAAITSKSINREGTSTQLPRQSFTPPRRPTQPTNTLVLHSQTKTKGTNTAPSNKSTTKARDDSLIIQGLPECPEAALHLREAHDRSLWADLCSKMDLNPINPKSITRLARKAGSLHAEKPRLIRVHFSDDPDLESVLLAAYKLVPLGSVHIFPDIPWAERQRRKNFNEAQSFDRARNVIIHGVPQSITNDPTDDIEQWKYLSRTL